jgi:hypothetical protein
VSNFAFIRGYGALVLRRFTSRGDGHGSRYNKNKTKGVNRTMNVKPLGDRVLVQPVEEAAK